MPDCMTFPDTVEEFMEQYKVVDIKQVYTNGTEFVPIYRMRQWFQHEPKIVRCKDCKYRGGLSGCYCDIVEKMVGFDSFCSWAERRTDERDIPIEIRPLY